MTHSPQDPRYTGETTDQPTAPPDQEVLYDQTATDPGSTPHADLGTTPVYESAEDTTFANANLEDSVGTTYTTPSTTDVAKGEAADVKDTAVEAGKQVAGTAKAEAQNVASEVKHQSKQLWQQTVSELGSQASNQQSHLAQLVGGYSSELRSMASNSEESGLITNLAGDAADRAEAIADWLSNREPKDVLEDVKRFARRRPVAFLAIAAASGFVLGRLTRGMIDDARPDSDDTSRDITGARSNYLTSYPAQGYTPATGYQDTTYPAAAYPADTTYSGQSYSGQPYQDQGYQGQPTAGSGVDLGTGPAEYGSGEGTLNQPGVAGGQSYSVEGDQRR